MYQSFHHDGKGFVMPFIVTTLFLIISQIMTPDSSGAERFTLSFEQKSQLAMAEKLAISAVALTEQGIVDSGSISQIVGTRMEEIGYFIVKNPQDPHDVRLKVKCEERKTWTGPSKTGGDADQPGAPSRLWKGPACLLSYFIDGQRGPWEFEVRTPFSDALVAAQKANIADLGTYALNQLKKELLASDFPLLLSAHWGQTSRLVKMLTAPSSTKPLKLKIMALAPQLSGKTMVEALQTTLRDPSLAEPATHALGYVGEEATPILLTLLETSESTDIQAASARSLGEMGSRSGDVSIIPPLLNKLNEPEIPLKVEIEIVRALGKVPDKQSVPALEAANLRAWTSRSDDPQIKELQEATVWSLWQINPSAHADN
jgi:hypothetical protein